MVHCYRIKHFSSHASPSLACSGLSLCESLLIYCKSVGSLLGGASESGAAARIRGFLQCCFSWHSWPLDVGGECTLLAFCLHMWLPPLSGGPAIEKQNWWNIETNIISVRCAQSPPPCLFFANLAVEHSHFLLFSRQFIKKRCK